ncbi:hypothetical protein NL676_014836 [Syzygium grande]|nr:hypothetical protein NL676_014836 [Syzygium grande]
MSCLELEDAVLALKEAERFETIAARAASWLTSVGAHELPASFEIDREALASLAFGKGQKDNRLHAFDESGIRYFHMHTTSLESPNFNE